MPRQGIFSEEWLELLETVASFCEGRVWYRGVTRNDYLLNSTLFRKPRESCSNYCDVERFLLNDFTARGFALRPTQQTKWDTLFCMAHYSVPTRLLDWTESFATALYFATRRGAPEAVRRVWMLKPEELNTLWHKEYAEGVLIALSTVEVPFDDFLRREGLHSLAVMPPYIDARVAAQLSRFVLQGNSCLPLEQEDNGVLLHKRILGFVDVPPRLCEDARRFLRLFGVSEFSLFPDLEHLALDIRVRYGFGPIG